LGTFFSATVKEAVADVLALSDLEQSKALFGYR
jgi:hypothetical protein